MVARPIHVFRPISIKAIDGNGNGVMVNTGQCRECGYPESASIHHNIPVAQRPEPPAFLPGDRVRWLKAPKNKLDPVATVIQVIEPVMYANGAGGVYSSSTYTLQTKPTMNVLLDDGTYHVGFLDEFEKLPPVPKFSSIEEAEAWMEQRVARGVS